MPSMAALSARRIAFASSDIPRICLTIPNRNPIAPIERKTPTNSSSWKNASVKEKPGGGPPGLPGGPLVGAVSCIVCATACSRVIAVLTGSLPIDYFRVF
jgi:hypothetical protein